MRLRHVLTQWCGLTLAVGGGALHSLSAQRSHAAARPSRRAERPRARVDGIGKSLPAIGKSLPAIGKSLPGLAVTFGVRVAPETTTVGTPFQVVVRVRAPLGSTVAFPAGPDSGGAVEALDPRTVATRPDSAATDVAATYRLAAWDVGPQPVVLGPVVVRAGGAVRTIPLNTLNVVVVQTVPARAGSRTPRPARPLYADPPPWWLWWAIAAAALTALALTWLVARWWRRRIRRPRASLGALAIAERDFTDLESLGLLEAGEAGRYVALVAEVVRSYLARRLPTASLSYTTHELIHALDGDARVPMDRVRAMLTETDLVKFARYQLPLDQVRAIARDARTLVIDIDAAVISAEVAARDAAARQAALEFDAQRAARASGHRGRAA